MEMVERQWMEQEFAGPDLGDARLDTRAKKLVERLAAKPTANNSGACDGWSETCAAYRFVRNTDVAWEHILASHWGRTQERMRAERVVLCILDTTELDVTGQEIAGLGPLNYEARHGMYLHPTYAVTTEREPLGVLDAWMWAREKRGDDAVRPGQKESARSVEGYERVAEMAVDMPGTRLVYLAGREADMVEMMRRARDVNTPADWLVRAKHDRCLPDTDGAKLWATTTSVEPLGEIALVTGARANQKSRTVRQQLWARRVERGRQARQSDGDLYRRARSGGTQWRQAHRMALVDEPRGHNAGTSAPIDRLVPRALGNRDLFPCTQERLRGRVIAIVQCRPAGTRLGAAHGGGLARSLPDAQGPNRPDLDASLFFDPDEIRGAYLLTKKKMPSTAPTVNEVVRLIHR